MFNKWEYCRLQLTKRYLELSTQDNTPCIKHIPIPEISNVSEYQDSKSSPFCLKITVEFLFRLF